MWKVFSQSVFFSFSFHMFVAIIRAQMAGENSPKVLALSLNFLAHILPEPAFFLCPGVIWKDFQDLWVPWWPGQHWDVNTEKSHLRHRKCTFCSDFTSLKHHENYHFWDLHLKKANKELTLLLFQLTFHTIPQQVTLRTVEKKWCDKTPTFPQHPAGLSFPIVWD